MKFDPPPEKFPSPRDMTISSCTGIRFGLHWPIKQSFLSYISALADGECSATDGCVIEPGFGFWFEAEPSSAPGDGLAFRGDLRFAGHHGMLFLRLAHPQVSLRGDSGTISVCTTDDERVEVASFRPLDLSGSADLVGTGLELTAQGAALFGDVYRAGQPLDDFTIIRPPVPKEAS